MGEISPPYGGGHPRAPLEFRRNSEDSVSEISHREISRGKAPGISLPRRLASRRSRGQTGAHRLKKRFYEFKKEPFFIDTIKM